MEIKPNNTLKQEFEKYFGYTRYCFNKALDTWKKEYKAGNKPTSRKVRDILKANKEEWESEYSPMVHDTAIENLDKAYKMFFKKIGRFPRFKSKRKAKKSFRFQRRNDSTIRIQGNRLYLPRMPYGIKMTETLRFNGVIKEVTISKRANKYFASFVIAMEDGSLPSRKSTNNYCGIDLGLKTFAIIADNEYFYDEQYPSKLKALYAKKNYLNKKLSKKNKSSNKFNVMKTKLQKVYLDIYNLQRDYLNKLTSWIIKKYDIICIETLNIKGMLKLRTLSGKLYNSLFYIFRKMLEHKSKTHGNKLINADRFFPSTQTCSHCGNVKKSDNKMKLSDRTYYCDKCGTELDRDDNAAINLRQYGLAVA